MSAIGNKAAHVRSEPVRNAAFDESMSLYLRGLSDRAIAEIRGVHRTTVKDWRKRNGLPYHDSKWNQVPADQERQRQADHAHGLSDPELAARWGVSASVVHKWRLRRSLPSNIPKTQHTPEQRAARMLLYSLGYSDPRIAKEQKVRPFSVFKWRKRYGLKANAPVKELSARGKVGSLGDAMINRIKRALPKYLSPADRDDAASDLFLAVMSGAIPIDEIERRAKTFGNRVMNDFASKWGNRSLDEELGEEDGFTLLDRLRDERSTSWLEEMGASAW